MLRSFTSWIDPLFHDYTLYMYVAVYKFKIVAKLKFRHPIKLLGDPSARHSYMHNLHNKG